MDRYVPAGQQDLPVLFRLNKQLIEDYEDLSSIDCDRVFGWVQRNLEETLPHFRKILRAGVPVGFFCLKGTELDSLFVFPEFQGQGIGTDVIRFCQDRSPSLFLYVFRKNTRAVALYRRMGFQILKEVGKTRYIMEWKNQDR